MCSDESSFIVLVSLGAVAAFTAWDGWHLAAGEGELARLGEIVEDVAVLVGSFVLVGLARFVAVILAFAWLIGSLS